jgi:rare lipoprotein A
VLDTVTVWMIAHFIVLYALSLAGCTGVRTPVGPTHVSCKPYNVRGAWYYPQKFYEYDEVGLASWYGGGDGCRGKPKATGEKFDHMSMTAAHRTLPIPSVARVTNLRNGKSVIVVVDDRGPYSYKGRIIDLSFAAARALDLHRYKPSPVRVQVLAGDSLRLSQYIATHCKCRRDPYGRKWVQLYFQEVLKISPRKCNGSRIQSRPRLKVL